MCLQIYNIYIIIYIYCVYIYNLYITHSIRRHTFLAFDFDKSDCFPRYDTVMIHELTKGNGMLETIDSGNKHWERKSTHTHIYIYNCLFSVWVIRGTGPRNTSISTPIESLNCLELIAFFLSTRQSVNIYIHMICTCYAQRPKGMTLIVRRVCYDENFVWRLPLLPGVAGNLMSTLAADGLKATELKNEYWVLVPDDTVICHFFSGPLSLNQGTDLGIQIW